MDLFAGNISHMIFEASINPDLGKISLSKVMLGVLSALSPTSVPVNRAAELIDLISIKSPIDDKKRAFQKSMLTRVTTTS